MEISPLTSSRLSYRSEPFNGGDFFTGTNSPPISPFDEFGDVTKVKGYLVAAFAGNHQWICSEQFQDAYPPVAPSCIVNFQLECRQ